MWRLYLIALMLCLPWCSYSKTILLVGDSLSAGYGLELTQSWTTLLQERLAKNYPDYRLINDSISGDTTSNGLTRLSIAIKRYQPSIIIIEYGGNDGLRGLSLSAMENNLADMIKISQKQGAKVLLLGVRLPPNYGLEYTKEFHQIYTNLGKKFRIVVMDRLLDDVGGKPEFMQEDGVHPNAKAQPFLLNSVWESLEPMLRT